MASSANNSPHPHHHLHYPPRMSTHPAPMPPYNHPYMSMLPPPEPQYSPSSVGAIPHQVFFDMSVRIAMLEKDLERCRSEKAEAEIAVQYLAQLDGTRTAKTSLSKQRENEALALKKKLIQATKDKKRLRAKLNQVNTLLATLEFAKYFATNYKLCPKSLETKVHQKTSDTECLIDLEDHSSTALAPMEDTSFSNESSDDLQYEADNNNGSTTAEAYCTPSTSFSSDLTNSSYIVRFSKDAGLLSKRTEEIKANSEGVTGSHELQSRAQSGSETLFERLSRNVTKPSLRNTAQEDLSSPKCSVLCLTALGSNAIENSQDEMCSADRHEGQDHPAHNCSKITTGKEAESMFEAEQQGEENTPDPDAIDAFGKRYSLVDPYTKWPNLCGTAKPATRDVRWNKKDFFESRTEREMALRIHQREAGIRDVGFPEFFVHGLQYTPTDPDSDSLRTTLILGLPAGTRMMHVLDKVRGGLIIDAQLLDTLSVTNTITAKVVFHRAEAAELYKSFVHDHPFTINGATIQVRILATPTWPINLRLRKAIGELSQTRCFEVHNIPSNIDPAVIKQDLCFSSVMKVGGLESMNVIREGILGLRFSSIRYAGQASGIFLSFPRYRGCKVHWLPDPCAQPLETLLEPSKPPTSTNTEKTVTTVAVSESESESVEDSSGRLAEMEPDEGAAPRNGHPFQEDKPIAKSVGSSFDVVSSAASSFCTLS